MLASFFVAMTVVPLFCAKWIKSPHLVDEHEVSDSRFGHIIAGFNRQFARLLRFYDHSVGRSLLQPAATTLGLVGVALLSFALYPLLGVAYFPRTDPGQFVINLKAPSGTRLELTERNVKQVEDEIRAIVPANELGMIVSNIGVTPGFSAIYTPNSAQHTAFVQVSLQEGHKVGSYEYMKRVRLALRNDLQRPVDSGAFSAEGFGGTLGSEFLRQFEVTFDLKHDKIFLKKDPRLKADRYRYVTIGVQFARNDQGTYSVMSVWKNSPADQAGIRLGDRMRAVNGESTSSMTAEQVSAELHGEEGTHVNLIIERDTGISAVTLPLRQLLCGLHSSRGSLRASQ
jgi:membrane-associated protease RseP (regulator of RpoE activity)